MNPFTELTKREMDTLELYTDGLSNSEITQQLVIGEYTVIGHVSNILSKLHQTDRTQAAVYAWKKGLSAAIWFPPANTFINEKIYSLPSIRLFSDLAVMPILKPPYWMPYQPQFPIAMGEANV